MSSIRCDAEYEAVYSLVRPKNLIIWNNSMFSPVICRVCTNVKIIDKKKQSKLLKQLYKVKSLYYSAV